MKRSLPARPELATFVFVIVGASCSHRSMYFQRLRVLRGIQFTPHSLRKWGGMRLTRNEWKSQIILAPHVLLLNLLSFVGPPKLIADVMNWTNSALWIWKFEISTSCVLPTVAQADRSQKERSQPISRQAWFLLLPRWHKLQPRIKRHQAWKPSKTARAKWGKKPSRAQRFLSN